jgi:hypothetical protein
MDTGALVFVTLTIVLGLLMAWDRVGRDLWADLLDALEDRGWLRPATPMRVVSAPDVLGDAPPAYVTRPPALEADTATDPGLSAGLSGLSELEGVAWDGLTLYRSREALLRALVAAGWKTGEIRAVVKGDNALIGQEVQAARRALGLEEEGVQRSPIAGRPIPPGVVFQEDALEAEPAPAR